MTKNEIKQYWIKNYYTDDGRSELMRDNLSDLVTYFSKVPSNTTLQHIRDTYAVYRYDFGYSKIESIETFLKQHGEMPKQKLDNLMFY